MINISDTHTLWIRWRTIFILADLSGTPDTINENGTKLLIYTGWPKRFCTPEINYYWKYVIIIWIDQYLSFLRNFISGKSENIPCFVRWGYFTSVQIGENLFFKTCCRRGAFHFFFSMSLFVLICTFDMLGWLNPFVYNFWTNLIANYLIYMTGINL